VQAHATVREHLDARLAAPARRRPVRADLRVAEAERVAVARADEEAEPDRAAGVAGVDQARLLGVLEHRLRADVAAGHVGRRLEATPVERGRRRGWDIGHS
jgi:glucose-6-phosphate dehydrogenase assembly protein OpcA